MNFADENNRNTLLDRELLLGAVAGKLIGPPDRDVRFTSVVTDSRNAVPGSLFVPLVGTVQDGHIYIPQALEKGASVIFVGRSEYESSPKIYDKLAAENSGTAFICVGNTLRALQQAAGAYVGCFPELIKIGITGSSGKTTTKELAVSVFSRKYNVVATKGNLNSETGLPLSVFNIRAGHEVGIFEMGMNRVGEIGEIASVLRPEYGIITNVGTAHIGILGSRKNIAAEKRKLFGYIPPEGAAFVSASDDFRDFLAENVRGKVVEFGPDVPEPVSGVRFVRDCGLDGTVFTLDGTEIRLPLPGMYNYSDALAVVACAREIGIPAPLIKEGIEDVRAVSGRMERLRTVLADGKSVTVIKDCYNANPDSMEKAIEFCSGIGCAGRRIFVLGDMLELGASSVQAHSDIGRKILEFSPDCVIFIGKEMQAAAGIVMSGGAGVDMMCLADPSDDSIARAAEKILSVADEESVILLKGSNGMNLSRIMPLIGASDADGGN